MKILEETSYIIHYYKSDELYIKQQMFVSKHEML
jgi:hypothetical protein